MYSLLYNKEAVQLRQIAAFGFKYACQQQSVLIDFDISRLLITQGILTKKMSCKRLSYPSFLETED